MNQINKTGQFAILPILRYVVLHKNAKGGSMTKETITFRTEAKKRIALDEVAEALDRDRSFVLNQAIDNYLDIYQWQVGHIRQGRRQARKGEFVSDAAWNKASSRRRT